VSEGAALIRPAICAQRDALATAGYACHGQKFSGSEKEFAGLRHDQAFAGELMFESKRAAGRNDAEGIAQIETDGDIARRSTDVDGRGDDGWCKDSELGGGGELHAHAAEIQRQRDGWSGLKQSEFRRATDIEFTSAGKRHAGLARMDGDYAAVHNEHARSAGSSPVCGGGPAFDGNVIALDAADRARRRRLLGAERRETKNEASEQKEGQQQATDTPMRGYYSASELELSGHWPSSRSPILYSSE